MVNSSSGTYLFSVFTHGHLCCLCYGGAIAAFSLGGPMFKNLLLAVLIAIVLTYSVGLVATQWLDLRVQIDQHWIEPFMTILIVTFVVALLVVVGFVVAISMIGAIVFAVCAGIIGIFVAGVGAFWPILLFALIVYYLVKDKTAAPQPRHY
jgi:hypothetical protein